MEKRELNEKRLKKHKLVIESNGMNMKNISIDGIDVSDAVTGIRFIHKGGEAPVVEMELMGCDVSVRNPRIPQLPEKFMAFYKPID